MQRNVIESLKVVLLVPSATLEAFQNLSRKHVDDFAIL
jgi:hypothetical protein